MFLQDWMREHETLAAVVAMALSVLIVAAFNWLERRFIASK
jgi:hypothetical protein